MATMHPRTLLDDEAKSPGEVRVFDALRDGLSDDWLVFFSVGFVRRDHATGAQDGEIDFVLCHPDEGIVCLEVKGGDLECRHGEWHRRAGAERTRVKDPFAQVTDHKYALGETIDRVDGWRAKDLFIVHAVGLPDIPVHSLVLAPDAPAEIVIDRRGFEDPAASLEKVLAFHRGSRDKRRPPGPDGVAMLRDLLAPTIEIEVPLATQFFAEDAALVELTREQAMLLARMARNPRMAIHGCAGSGKTMLGVEHARRLAEDGKDVLFVCFNRALAAHLHTSIANPRIDFSNFHRLCVRMAKKAGVELPEHPADDTPQEFWDVTLPDAFVDAIEVLGPQWDALIVDEAQDLTDDWLAALRCGLRDEEDAPVWLFLDDNQRVYEDRLTVPRDFFAYELPTNCRNTQAIHRELLKLYEGGTKPDVRGPEGRPPDLIHADDQPAAVGRVLDRLLGPDDIPAADVVVLSSHGPKKSAVATTLAGRLCNGPTPKGSDEVRFSSIRGFKGLEAAVVVLCELEDLDERSRDHQLYVGLSRARNHAVLVAPG
jgi:hypothetical protein